MQRVAVDAAAARALARAAAAEGAASRIEAACKGEVLLQLTDALLDMVPLIITGEEEEPQDDAGYDADDEEEEEEAAFEGEK